MEMLMEVVDVCGFGDGLIDCAVVWKLGCGDEIESFLQHGELLWCEVMVVGSRHWTEQLVMLREQRQQSYTYLV